MYSRDKLFTRSLECYFGVYSPRCCTTRKMNTKITPSWAHKQFATPVHKLFSMSALLSECIIATWHGMLSVLMVSSLHKGQVMRRFTVFTCQNFLILASMFVWRFVCLFVCLSVRIKVVSRIQVAPFDQSSPDLNQMCILVIARNPFTI